MCGGAHAISLFKEVAADNTGGTVVLALGESKTDTKEEAPVV